MIICTRDCLPFSTCAYTDKQRRRVVCQYTKPGWIMARKINRDNERWIKSMVVETDKGMVRKQRE